MLFKFKNVYLVLSFNFQFQFPILSVISLNIENIVTLQRASYISIYHQYMETFWICFLLLFLLNSLNVLLSASLTGRLLFIVCHILILQKWIRKIFEAIGGIFFLHRGFNILFFARYLGSTGSLGFLQFNFKYFSFSSSPLRHSQAKAKRLTGTLPFWQALTPIADPWSCKFAESIRQIHR